MKKIIVLLITIFAASPVLFSQTKAGKVDTVKHATFYSCPKHAEIVSEEPGKCPKCGMELNLSPKEQLNKRVTKNYSCPVHLDVFTHNPGKCPQCGQKLALSTKEQMKTEVVKSNTCPMHPDIALDKEGKCPKCSATK
jgi:transcription initiation factor IIE alpha subunit